jgi:hypothetical protein
MDIAPQQRKVALGLGAYATFGNLAAAETDDA